MINKIIFLAIFISCVTDFAYSQSNFWDDIKIRKSFESETSDDDKAANLSLTFPKGKQNSYVINAGIGYETFNIRKELFKSSFRGFFVFNRNNEIDKEQRNYKAGVSWNQTFFTDSENIQAFMGTHALEYLRDFSDSSHSALLTTYWHFFSKKKDQIKIGGYAIDKTLFLFYLIPQIGLEYQNKFKTIDVESPGSDLRGYFSLGASILLKKKTFTKDTTENPSLVVLAKKFWTKGIELKINYDGRYSVIRSVTGTDVYKPLFKSEIMIYPTQDNNFSIGLSYNNGSNPIDGLEKQNFFLLALKFKK